MADSGDRARGPARRSGGVQRWRRSWHACMHARMPVSGMHACVRACCSVCRGSAELVANADAEAVGSIFCSVEGSGWPLPPCHRPGLSTRRKTPHCPHLAGSSWHSLMRCQGTVVDQRAAYLRRSAALRGLLGTAEQRLGGGGLHGAWRGLGEAAKAGSEGGLWTDFACSCLTHAAFIVSGRFRPTQLSCEAYHNVRPKAIGVGYTAVGWWWCNIHEGEHSQRLRAKER